MESAGKSRLLSLPGEIRNIIYQKVLVLRRSLLLFDDAGASNITIRLFAPGKPDRWLSLLYTNRMIHAEARAVLYGFNEFLPMDSWRSWKIMPLFLDGIGSINTGYVTRLHVSFPAMEYARGRAGEDIFRKGAERKLKFLRNRCTGLKYLEAVFHTKNSRWLTAATYNPDHSRSIRDALAQVNACLKTMPSLRNVVIKAFNAPLAPEVVGLMREFGWAFAE